MASSKGKAPPSAQKSITVMFSKPPNSIIHTVATTTPPPPQPPQSKTTPSLLKMTTAVTKAPPAAQKSISTMFSKPTNSVVYTAADAPPLSSKTTPSLLKPTGAVEAAAAKTGPTITHAEPYIQAFYDQLTPAEIIAHTIAVDKLGTSYDITRTHGFLRWAKANPRA